MMGKTKNPNLEKNMLPKCKGRISTYFKMAEESDGFDVNDAGRCLSGGICKADKDNLETIEAAQAAVDIYNDQNNTNLMFESIVKVNGQSVGGFLYYITLKARLPTDKHSKLYQAKVFLPPAVNEFRLILFRERPIPPKLRKGAFFCFMNALRKHPLTEDIDHEDIWRSMSPFDKSRYHQTRNLDEFVNLTIIVRAFLKKGLEDVKGGKDHTKCFYSGRTSSC